MRILLAVLTLSLTAHAGQLDLAVVQFPEGKTAAELDAALAGVQLAKITNSNRTMTSESYLKGGYVLFAQSLPSDSRFATATRIADFRADVEGRLFSGRAAVKITLSEGVDAGLRRFSSRTYVADAPLPPGPPRVLSLRKISSRTREGVKGQTTVKDVDSCFVVIGQLSK